MYTKIFQSIRRHYFRRREDSDGVEYKNIIIFGFSNYLQANFNIFKSLFPDICIYYESIIAPMIHA